MRKVAFAVVGALLVTVLLAAAGEAVFRLGHFPPRTQIIRGSLTPRPDAMHLRVIDGQPVWEEPGTAERHDDACQTPDSYDVLLLGSSIFYGTSHGPDEVLSAVMKRALADADRTVCIHNYAQPAMVSASKYALATEAIPRLKPELVIWELWRNDPGSFTLIGEDAYNVSFVPTNRNGMPHTLPLPVALNDALFVRSAFYEYATLALSGYDSETYTVRWRALIDETLTDLKALTEAHGGELRLAFVPMLDVPFAESVTIHRTKLRGYQWTATWAEEQGVPTLDLAEALVGEDVEALRNDPCCHYNAAGHQRVGEVLAAWVREALAEGSHGAASGATAAGQEEP